MIGTPDSEIVSGVMRSIVEHEMPHEVLSATAMRQKYPQFKLSDDEVGVYEANAGYLMAELCVESYIALARKYGADLHFEEAMLDWWSVAQGGAGVPPSLERGVQVRTAKGTYFARKLVLSVGAWAPSMYGAVIPKMQLYIERRVLFWFQASEQSVDAFKVRPAGLLHLFQLFIANIALFCRIFLFTYGTWGRLLGTSTASRRSRRVPGR